MYTLGYRPAYRSLLLYVAILLLVASSPTTHNLNGEAVVDFFNFATNAPRQFEIRYSETSTLFLNGNTNSNTAYVVLRYREGTNAFADYRITRYLSNPTHSEADGQTYTRSDGALHGVYWSKQSKGIINLTSGDEFLVKTNRGISFDSRIGLQESFLRVAKFGIPAILFRSIEVHPEKFTAELSSGTIVTGSWQRVSEGIRMSCPLSRSGALRYEVNLTPTNLVSDLPYTIQARKFYGTRLFEETSIVPLQLVLPYDGFSDADLHHDQLTLTNTPIVVERTNGQKHIMRGNVSIFGPSKQKNAQEKLFVQLPVIAFALISCISLGVLLWAIRRTSSTRPSKGQP